MSARKLSSLTGSLKQPTSATYILRTILQAENLINQYSGISFLGLATTKRRPIKLCLCILPQVREAPASAAGASFPAFLGSSHYSYAQHLTAGCCSKKTNPSSKSLSKTSYFMFMKRTFHLTWTFGSKLYVTLNIFKTHCRRICMFNECPSQPLPLVLVPGSLSLLAPSSKQCIDDV